MTVFDIFTNQLLNGIVLGSFYALVALGYTMVFGVVKLLNFAHGELYMVGGFAGFLVLSGCRGNSSECDDGNRLGIAGFSSLETSCLVCFRARSLGLPRNGHISGLRAARALNRHLTKIGRNTGRAQATCR